jgi:Fe2+ or Zn2+ uptake regulation protein
MKHEQLLKHYRLKVTPQRIAIIELMDVAGHISIDDLYHSIRKRFASISLATLYKNVHTMMAKNLIREVKVPGQKAKYEIEKKPHAHLLCKSCGELKDIEFDPSTLIENAEKNSSYEADEVSIVISGTCPHCRQ